MMEGAKVKKVLGAISNIMEILTIVCFLVLAFLVFFQISGRWVDLKDIGWTDEMVSCFTTWMVFMGVAYMCERDGHIQITMLQDVLPRWMKTFLVVLIRLLNIACGVAITYSGLVWTKSTATKLTSFLQISFNIWYNAVWICGGIFTLFAVAKLLESLASLNAEKKSPAA